ncbi:MAG: DUF4422 domain-containing protein [Lachnospiraceae bacterium]|nr:DUF4422 domain-containing protein [Lachnospiraceae bacterium]
MEKQLKNYVISSPADMALEEAFDGSEFDIHIQAGAALTGDRTCDINDHDGFAESISDRNQRYSEATAMWWIMKHLDTPYVGIAHYRRRFALSDDQISGYIEDGVDIITTNALDMEISIEEAYRELHYSKDWDLFMNILGIYSPKDVPLAKEVFSSTLIHKCNINIFRRELYSAFCNWAFPILDCFYNKSPRKTDLYQRRDVGFIAERLSHLFVEKMISQGRRVVCAGLKELKSKEWQPSNELQHMTCADEVFDACNQLYKSSQIGRSYLLMTTANEIGICDESNLPALEILKLGEFERQYYSRTLHDYLPPFMRENLYTLQQTFSDLRNKILACHKTSDLSATNTLKAYLAQTHITPLVAADIGILNGIDQDDMNRLISILYT